MSANTNSRIYRVGDYVYVETAPVYPYQIRRIEELTKLGNGQIEAKVQCFYRRRDLSTPLIAQADRHAAAAEEDAEIDMGDVELDDVKMHQLSHRELFLSRQYETINASQIRGKCLVTLYCETEILPRYAGKEDWFYYCLVYDPQQKALLADKGEIGIGSNYQPVIPQILDDTSKDVRDLSLLETKVWTSGHNLTDREVDQFLVVSRSVGTFARALDCSSSVKQPSLHMSAAAASRDITQFHALCVLHKSNYDMSKAVGCLVPSGGPVLCRDEMEEWSAGEAGLFEEAINKYGKDFSDIQKDFLPWKSISSIIEYYYMWKTTDRYVRQKRMKSAEKESDLKQILVSNPPGTTCVTGSGDKESVNSIPYPPPGVITKAPSPGYSCESCYANTSTHWFPWSAPNTQYRHYVCSVCWVYWKKYGGLKKPDGFSSRRVGEEVRYTCRICGKVFNRAALLSHHMVTHKPYKCYVTACDKTFNTEANLTRHLSACHALRPRSPQNAKPKDAFYMKVPSLIKVSRYLCGDLVKFPRMARVFNVLLEINDVQEACLKRVSREVVERIIAERKIKQRKPLEGIVEVLKTSPPKMTTDVTIPSQAATHVTKTRSKSTSSIHPSPITSPTRKMLHSPRLYIPQVSLNEVAEPRPAHSSKHLLSRKRSLENVNAHQNGLDGPATKRFVSNSPLGKKGCECKHCGKVLHNQASLSHHMQTAHAVAYQPTQGSGPPKQKSYPAYCDVNPGTGPGVTKMAPYAEHTVTSYNTTGLKSSSKPPGSIPINQPLSKPPAKNQLNSPALAPGLNRKVSAAVDKNPPVVNGQNKSRGRSSPTRQPQFIDPPEEFVFSATKVMRSARKSISEEVKRRLPRKPWMEVKCPAELRELVYRTRKPRKAKERTPIGTPTKADHILSDGKKASPVKNEVADAVAPRVTVNDEKTPVVSEDGVPLKNIKSEENISMPIDKPIVSPVGQVATGAGQVAGGLGPPGKTGGIGGTRMDEPIVIDD